MTRCATGWIPSEALADGPRTLDVIDLEYLTNCDIFRLRHDGDEGTVVPLGIGKVIDKEEEEEEEEEKEEEMRGRLGRRTKRKRRTKGRREGRKRRRRKRRSSMDKLFLKRV